MNINKKQHAQGTRLIAHVIGDSSKILELTISEWSHSGNFFRAKINGKKKSKWLNASLYIVIDTLDNGDKITTVPEIEPIVESATEPTSKLSVASVSAIDSMLNEYTGSHDDFKTKLFSIMSVDEINDTVESFGPNYLRVVLQKDMLSEFNNIWSGKFKKIIFQNNFAVAGTIVAGSPKAPPAGFLKELPNLNNQTPIEHDNESTIETGIMLGNATGVSCGNKIVLQDGTIYKVPVYGPSEVLDEHKVTSICPFEELLSAKVYTDIPGSPIGKEDAPTE